MAERNKWIVLVTQLLRATQENEIRWARVEYSLPARSGRRITKSYETSFRGKRFRIFQSDSLMVSGPQDRMRESFPSTVELQFIDDDGQSIFDVPDVAGLSDLIAAAEYQSADIDDFLNSLMKSPA